MTVGAHIPLWAGLGEAADLYSHAIIDLWGVMHNGRSLMPGAVEAVMAARRAGLQTVFLSNAPRTRTVVRAHLEALGVPAALRDAVVTSGALARDAVRRDFRGARLYHLGPPSDDDMLQDLPATFVGTLDDAEVIFATGLAFPDLQRHRALLAGAAGRGLPFLCANPDRSVDDGPNRLPCAGAVADLYAELGGPVHWFGKPAAAAYQGALTALGLATEALDGAARRRILMIGDNLQTDIAGARALGLSSLLVAGGLHRTLIAGIRAGSTGLARQALHRAAQAAGVPVEPYHETWGPDAVIPALIW